MSRQELGTSQKIKMFETDKIKGVKTGRWVMREAN